MNIIERLNLSLKEIFERLGAEDINVTLNIVRDQQPIAGATGFKIFKKVYGEIFLSSKLINMLTIDELNFILGHEATHIYMNHMSMKIMSNLPREIIKFISMKSMVALVSLYLSDLIKYYKHVSGELSGEAEITLNQELQADMWSIIINSNKSAAISCLKKLVNYDLNKPSHTWEILGIRLPIMSMKDRINMIEDRVKILEKLGIHFK